MIIKYRNLRFNNKSREKQLINLFKKFLLSGFYLRSKKSNLIEKKISSFVGHNYCHLLSSGTNAIYLALKALGIKKGDEVICPIISWVATANAISILGAKPIFIDVKIDQNINVDLVEKKISSRTKAIIAVHFKGIICDVIRLKKISKKHKIFLIEDVAQAFGSEIVGKKAGSFGDISCYSFNPMKVLKSFGELGAITTNNKKFYKKIESLQYLGTVNKEICVDVDLNSKSDELHAYLISNSLKYLKKDIHLRKKIISNYKKYLPNSVINKEYDMKLSNGYDYQIIVSKRDKLIKYLKQKKIETRIKHPLILNDHPAHFTKENFKVGKFIKNHSLSMPIHDGIRLKEIKYISSAIKKFYDKKI